MTVFAGAVDAAFAAFGIDAVYTPEGGAPVSVRVIARRPDTIVGFGETRIHTETATFELRASDVANPRPGDQLTAGGETFVVQGEPERRDPDRLLWSLDVRRASCRDVGLLLMRVTQGSLPSAAQNALDLMAAKAGAGAAVSSGADYQGRIAAYLMACALTGTPVQEFGDREAKTLGFETAEAVDDLNVEFTDGVTGYIQAKRSINYSLRAESDLRGVFTQFVAQHRAAGANRAYYLAVSTTSSKKITGDMRAALDAFRESPNDAFFRDQPKALTDIIVELRAAVTELLADAGTATSADNILRLVYVVLLDLSEGECLQKATVLLLQSRGYAPAPLLWSKPVSDAVNGAGRRLTLNMDAVRARLEQFRLTDERSSVTVDDDILKIVFQSAEIPVGREYLLGTFDEDSVKDQLSIVELLRFDGECRERTAFEANSAHFGDLPFTVIRRAATRRGILRFLEENPWVVSGREVVVLPAEFDGDPESGLCAEHHREIVKRALLANPAPMRCLRCAKPISEAQTTIIEETDWTGTVIAGLVHNRCLAPADRVIGISQCEFFREYDFLINFEANAWFRASHGGQVVFRGADLLKASQQAIAWGGPGASSRVGDFVIEIQLAGGDAEFVSRRGTIDRLSEREAEEAAASMFRTLTLSRDRGDSLCMTDQTRMFGPQSFVKSQVGVSEKVRLVEGFRVRRYDAKLSRRYEGPQHWYAPLMYLHDLIEDRPVILNGFVPILTDPLLLGRHMANWAEAGLTIHQYETVSLLDDRAVDDFLGQVEATNLPL